MAKLYSYPFNYTSYWNRFIYPPVWVERLDHSFPFNKETEDLDYFSIKVEGVEISPNRPPDYEKYTMEQFKFEEDFNDYYPD